MRSLSLWFVLALGLFVAAGCGGTDGGGDGGDGGSRGITTNDEFNEMLDGLGFNTNVGTPEDPYGNPLPLGYHPLGKKFTAFQPASELYIAGLVLDSVPEHLFDDSSESYAPLPFSSKLDTAWTTATLKNGIGADVDGDGLDEFVAVYYVEASTTLRYIMVDPGDDNFREGTIDVSADSANLDTLLQPAMAAGDMDGDDRDEIYVGFSKLYVLDELDQTAVISSRTYPDQNDLFVAAGNLDLDPEDELVVTYTNSDPTKIGRYEIFDGSLGSPVEDGDLIFTDPENLTRTARESQVAIGDVDGDRLGEIVYFGLTSNEFWAVFIMEYQGPDETPLYDWREFLHRPGWRSGNIPRPLMTFDADGDYQDEIFVHSVLLEVTSDPAPEVVSVGFGGGLARAAAADMDGDGRGDIIYESSSKIIVRGLDSLDVWSEKMRWAGTTTPWSSVILAPGNIDHDSAMVRYDGEYELLFTDPTIIATMASPPYHSGIDQSDDDTVSTFGKVSGTTVEQETAVGFSTGASLGYEADFGIFGGAEMSLSIEQSLDFTSSQSTTIEKYNAYTSGPGEDKVVFTTVPFDVYYYTIVSSPAPEDVGRTVTINIPREIQTLASSTGFYNEHNGEGVDVDEDVFGHRPGDVWSYPSADDKNQILREAEASQPGYQSLWNGPRPVSEGTGFDTIGISTTEGSGRGASMDVDVKLEFSTTAPGGAKVGTSVGFHYGFSYNLTTEDTAFFEGTVGNIPGANYTPDNLYQYGLMVYPQQFGDQNFLVMNYWVEP
jgi:hypothetical protein